MAPFCVEVRTVIVSIQADVESCDERDWCERVHFTILRLAGVSIKLALRDPARERSWARRQSSPPSSPPSGCLIAPHSPQGVCQGLGWSDEPCRVPCEEGYYESGDSYTCNLLGAWEGAPRCIPEWTVGEWSACSSDCGPGRQDIGGGARNTAEASRRLSAKQTLCR